MGAVLSNMILYTRQIGVFVLFAKLMKYDFYATRSAAMISH